MNRDLMNRQMFKMGGAAFPDLSGDGQVTQKDILMGRGVIEKQEGGMVPQAPMMMEEAMVAAPEPAMMPQDPMMMPQEGQASPEGFTQIFDQMQGQMDTLDESDDLEEMMNAVRGDVQPVEARRAELAEYVGPDDAQQTPDTVLALVQPVMQLASIDQGIGSLAADEMMDTPVEGPMAEGIMSTVNMAPDMAAPPTMMEVGSPPPVNFNQGGAVQYFADENPQRVAVPNTPTAEQLAAFKQLALSQNQYPKIDVPTLKEEFGEFQDVYRSIMPSDELNQQLLQQQREQTQAQMLFDVANTALAFATPGSRQMSPAERLAESAKETQLFDKLGARSQNLLDLKKEQELTRQKQLLTLDTAALQSAIKSRSDLTAAEQARALQRIKNMPTGMVNIGLQGRPNTMINVPESLQPLYAQMGYVEFGAASQSDTGPKAVNFQDQNTEKLITVIEGTPEYDALVKDPDQVLTGPATQSTAAQRVNYKNFKDMNTGKIYLIDVTSPDGVKRLTELQALHPNNLVLAGTATISDDDAKLSDTLRILSDPTSMAAYADGTLDNAGVATIEAAIADQYSPKERPDGKGGTIVSADTPTKLVTDSYRTRLESGLPTSDFSKLFPQIKPVTPELKMFLNAGEVAEGEEEVVLNEAQRRENKLQNQINIAAEIGRQYKDGKVPVEIYQSPEFKKLYFNPSGQVNPDSLAWRLRPTSIFSPQDIKLEEYIGIGSIPDRVIDNARELFRELGLKEDRLTTDGKMKFDVDRKMQNLMLQLTGALVDTTIENRIPARISAEIERVKDEVNSGIFAYDANNLAAVGGIREQLQILFADNALSLPDYFGIDVPEASKLLPIQREQKRLESVIAELVAFEDNLKLALDFPNPAFGKIQSGNREEDQNTLRQELKRQRDKR
jgi:hypothetical protein